ncbi:MAG: hypothetical protein ACREAK_10980 [Nitrosarchaeum sp.]
MVVSQQNVRACRNCGILYSEISRLNPMLCPLCRHSEGEDIAGIHY